MYVVIAWTVDGSIQTHPEIVSDELTAEQAGAVAAQVRVNDPGLTVGVLTAQQAAEMGIE